MRLLKKIAACLAMPLIGCAVQPTSHWEDAIGKHREFSPVYASCKFQVDNGAASNAGEFANKAAFILSGEKQRLITECLNGFGFQLVSNDNYAGDLGHKYYKNYVKTEKDCESIHNPPMREVCLDDWAKDHPMLDSSVAR